MRFLPVASGDGSDEGDAGLGGVVRTSGRDCPGVTAGFRQLPGAVPPSLAPGNDATLRRSGRGPVRAPVPGCFTGHDDHINPDRPENATDPKMRPRRSREPPTAPKPPRPRNPDGPEPPTAPNPRRPRSPDRAENTKAR